MYKLSDSLRFKPGEIPNAGERIDPFSDSEGSGSDVQHDHQGRGEGEFTPSGTAEADRSTRYLDQEIDSSEAGGSGSGRVDEAESEDRNGNKNYAFRGAFELINAQWSLDFGRTVDFRILEEPGHDKVNAFKQYQRKRNGRVGQSFYAVIVPDGQTQPTYESDVMLAGWGDTSDKGQWVRFWLDEEAGLHPFSGFHRRTSGVVGQLFAAAINITTEPNGHPGDVPQSKNKGRTLSQMAFLTITQARFKQWLEEKSEFTRKLHAQGRTWDANTVKAYVKWVLKIESLGDLDRVTEAAERFQKEFEQPFNKWSGRE